MSGGEFDLVSPALGSSGGGLREAPVDRDVRLPPLTVELRRHDHVVVERPQGRVGEALVVQLDVLGRQRHRHQVLDPAGRPGAAEVLGGGIEDESLPIGLVEGHEAPHRVRVQVPQRLLGTRQVAHHQRVEQQWARRGGEPLRLLAEPHLGRIAPIAEVDREAAQRDDVRIRIPSLEAAVATVHQRVIFVAQP